MYPCDGRLDHVREPLRQLVGRHLQVDVVRLAVLDVARAAGVHERRVGRGDADQVRPEVQRDALDVARHRLRVLDFGEIGADGALGGTIGVRRQEVALVGGVAVVGGTHQRIFGDGLGVPVVHRLTELAANVLGVRPVVDVYVDDRADDLDRATEVGDHPEGAVRRDERRAELGLRLMGLVGSSLVGLLRFARAPGDDSLSGRRGRLGRGSLAVLRGGGGHPLDRLRHAA